jgi:hypothetical protein
VLAKAYRQTETDKWEVPLNDAVDLDLETVVELISAARRPVGEQGEHVGHVHDLALEFGDQLGMGFIVGRGCLSALLSGGHDGTEDV